MLKPAGRQGRDPNAYLKVKLRRRSVKFIPDADGEFAFTAKQFAETLAKDPSRFPVPAEDVEAIVRAVEQFRSAVAANSHSYTKSRKTARDKDVARELAERLVRDAGNLIRVSKTVDESTKRILRISTRPKRLRRHERPVTAPILGFVGPGPASNPVDATHILTFRDPMARPGSNSRPRGVERLELYCELVPPNDPIPTRADELGRGRTLYLRSFKRSPFKVTYPKCDQPMRVVYWARWASPSGERGPWSQVLVTRVEGLDRPLLPAPTGLGAGTQPRKEQVVIVTSGHRQLPDLVDPERVEIPRMLTDERDALDEAA